MEKILEVFKGEKIHIDPVLQTTIKGTVPDLRTEQSGVVESGLSLKFKRPRKDKKLPVVLSKEEVANILSSIDNIKHKAILMLVYSAGLRVGEVVRLKLEDIDSKRMLIHIKEAKGISGTSARVGISEILRIAPQKWGYIRTYYGYKQVI